MKPAHRLKYINKEVPRQRAAISPRPLRELVTEIRYNCASQTSP